MTAREPDAVPNRDGRGFPLGEVLSIVTGKLLCDVGGLYRVLDFLTGEALMTHQLPRAARVCRPFLAQQHPDLAAIDASTVTATNWRDWLACQVRQFGKTRTLRPIPREAWERKDPLEEAVEMMGGDASRVIVVTTDRDDA
jgi:hypothetical protein